MKLPVSLLFILLLLHNACPAQSKTLQKFAGTPFQGTKAFCDFIKPIKYKVFINGYHVTITEYYKDEQPRIIKGVYKGGKLFTDDPTEKQYKASGRYYVIYPASFGINNLEGGDYIQYELCK